MRLGRVLILLASVSPVAAGTWFAASSYTTRIADRRVDAISRQAAETVRWGREANDLVVQTRLMVLQSLRGKLPTDAAREGVRQRAEELAAHPGTAALGEALGALVAEWTSLLEHVGIVRELDRELAGLHGRLSAELQALEEANLAAGQGSARAAGTRPTILALCRLDLLQLRTAFLSVQLGLLRYLEGPDEPEPDGRPFESLFESLQTHLEELQATATAPTEQLERLVADGRVYRDTTESFFGVFFDIRNRLPTLAQREQALLAVTRSIVP